MSLIEISNLSIIYKLGLQNIHAVQSLNLNIKKNELVAVVGESGCGKSTLALSIIGLLTTPPAQITNGKIIYKGTNLLNLDNNQFLNFRGTEIAMIFQQPMTSLNPSYKIGEQIGEAIDIKEQRSDSSILSNKYETNQPDFEYSKNKFLFGNLLNLSNLKRISNRKSYSDLYKKEIVEILKLVRIPDPSEIINRYPHELSGGMMQRVMIAMALSQKPSLLIADEPTTSLDVTTQAQILRLMKDLMNEIGTSILLITHDLSIAAEIADRINVMYGGQLIEESTIYDLFSKPLHPYTQSLLNCIPSGFKGEKIMKGIPGSVPLLHKIKNECQFANRCSKIMPKCSESKPDYLSISKSHKVECFLYE